MPPEFQQFLENLLAAGAWVYFALLAFGVLAAAMQVMIWMLFIRFVVWAWGRLERAHLDDQRRWLETVGEFNPALWPALARMQRRKWSNGLTLAMVLAAGIPGVTLALLYNNGLGLVLGVVLLIMVVLISITIIL